MPTSRLNPFEDPTTRLRSEINPFVAKLKDSDQLPALYGPQLEKAAKNWKQTLKSENSRLFVEIGCHKGDVICEMAKAHPEDLFLGLDITFKRVVLTAGKAIENQLDNLKSILSDARCLPLLFEEGSVDGIVIFFPDPWAKKARQQKNRLIDSEFLNQVYPLVKDDGFVWLKTDHSGYFEQCLSAAEQTPWQSSEKAKYELCQETYISRFEKQFTAKGLGTYEHVWAKTKVTH